MLNMYPSVVKLERLRRHSFDIALGEADPPWSELVPPTLAVGRNANRYTFLFCFFQDFSHGIARPCVQALDQQVCRVNIVSRDRGLLAVLRHTLAQGASGSIWSLRMIGVVLAFLAQAPD